MSKTKKQEVVEEPTSVIQPKKEKPVIKNILGKKTLYYYVSLIAFTSVLFGVILDNLIIVESIDHSNLVHQHHDHGILPILFTVLFIGILATCLSLFGS